MRTVSIDLLFIARKKNGGHRIRLKDIGEQTFETHYVLLVLLDCYSRHLYRHIRQCSLHQKAINHSGIQHAFSFMFYMIIANYLPSTIKSHIIF